MMGQLSELNTDCTVFTLLDSLLNCHGKHYLEISMHDLAPGTMILQIVRYGHGCWHFRRRTAV
jgi:hypothetical protein